MRKHPTPSVPDLARAQGETLEDLVDWFVEYFNAPIVPWSYLTATRICMSAYRGFSNIEMLLAGCAREYIEVQKANASVVKLAAPVAFGRQTQVFNLSARKFEFGHGFRSGYRIPFFFTERGVVKLYFLQPRISYALNADQLAMVATIHKMFILDMDFYGSPSDVEYVDVSAPEPLHAKDMRVRTLRTHSLSDLNLWSYDRLEARLSLISEALRFIQSNNLVVPRPVREVVLPDMPLFK